MRVAAPDKICDPLPILEHTDERVCGLTVFSRWLVGIDRLRGSFGPGESYLRAEGLHLGSNVVRCSGSYARALM
jgi:hypothetical protein